MLHTSRPSVNSVTKRQHEHNGCQNEATKISTLVREIGHELLKRKISRPDKKYPAGYWEIERGESLSVFNLWVNLTRESSVVRLTILRYPPGHWIDRCSDQLFIRG
ncbi:unnamed protein product [Leptosia nina]|uniref:Uncharacterized protein n=1 Tax=Leptosia nina TaxID=320188 RepID=A0AAV1IYQ9_9NEOP